MLGYWNRIWKRQVHWKSRWSGWSWRDWKSSTVWQKLATIIIIRIIIFLDQGLALVQLLNNLRIILTSSATCFVSLVQISLLHILFPMCQLAITLSTFTIRHSFALSLQTWHLFHKSFLWQTANRPTQSVPSHTLNHSQPFLCGHRFSLCNILIYRM